MSIPRQCNCGNCAICRYRDAFTAKRRQVALDKRTQARDNDIEFCYLMDSMHVDIYKFADSYTDSRKLHSKGGRPFKAKWAGASG
jgi:hypothetical protein